jgi:HSP20 family protein
MRSQYLPSIRNGQRGISPFDLLQERMDRMFEELSGGFGMPRLAGEGGFDINPSLDVHEADGKLMITAELPGVDEKDIDVTVNDQMLTISGEKKSESEHKEGGFLRSERSYGRFSRSVSLPYPIDPDKVQATYDRGVLKLTIEKPPEAQQRMRKIPISH